MEETATQTTTGPTAPQAASANEPALTGHVYDGIEEYDNPTPSWWTWIFIGTIAFSALYFFVVTLTDGQLSAIGFYDRAVLDEMKKAGVLKADAPTLMRLSKDADSIKDGQSIFLSNCVTCHGRDGSGITGPNLTDDLYINVTKITDIPDVVTKGRNNGAMPTWGNRLSPNEIVKVSAFVASLRGQNLRGKPVEPSARQAPPWSE
jgi:cytochrome c oxidase cbb3-type subunit 3